MKRRSDDQKPISHVERARLHRQRVEARARAEVSERRQRQKVRDSIPRVEKSEPEWWKREDYFDNHIGYEDDFDNYRIEPQDILYLLRTMENGRRTLRNAAIELQRYVEDSPGFAKTWREFMQAGGVSADDFERFLDDRMRHRSIKRKRHLRLVANNTLRPLVLRRGRNDDDAA
jgi:hypothetical protein